MATIKQAIEAIEARIAAIKAGGSTSPLAEGAIVNGELRIAVLREAAEYVGMDADASDVDWSDVIGSLPDDQGPQDDIEVDLWYDRMAEASNLCRREG